MDKATDKPTDIGMNRTGIATSPIDSRRTIDAAEAAGTAGPLDGKALEAERVLWARDADPVGTVPPPGTLKGIAKAVIETLQGHKLTVLIDKLGERLAYERTAASMAIGSAPAAPESTSNSAKASGAMSSASARTIGRSPVGDRQEAC